MGSNEDPQGPSVAGACKDSSMAVCMQGGAFQGPAATAPRTGDAARPWPLSYSGHVQRGRKQHNKQRGHQDSPGSSMPEGQAYHWPSPTDSTAAAAVNNAPNAGARPPPLLGGASKAWTSDMMRLPSDLLQALLPAGTSVPAAMPRATSEAAAAAAAAGGGGGGGAAAAASMAPGAAEAGSGPGFPAAGGAAAAGAMPQAQPPLLQQRRRVLRVPVRLTTPPAAVPHQGPGPSQPPAGSSSSAPPWQHVPRRGATRQSPDNHRSPPTEAAAAAAGRPGAISVAAAPPAPHAAAAAAMAGGGVMRYRASRSPSPLGPAPAASRAGGRQQQQQQLEDTQHSSDGLTNLLSSACKRRRTPRRGQGTPGASPGPHLAGGGWTPPPPATAAAAAGGAGCWPQAQAAAAAAEGASTGVQGAHWREGTGEQLHMTSNAAAPQQRSAQQAQQQAPGGALRSQAAAVGARAATGGTLLAGGGAADVPLGAGTMPAYDAAAAAAWGHVGDKRRPGVAPHLSPRDAAQARDQLATPLAHTQPPPPLLPAVPHTAAAGLQGAGAGLLGVLDGQQQLQQLGSGITAMEGLGLQGGGALGPDAAGLPSSSCRTLEDLHQQQRAWFQQQQATLEYQQLLEARQKVLGRPSALAAAAAAAGAPGAPVVVVAGPAGLETHSSLQEVLEVEGGAPGWSLVMEDPSDDPMAGGEGGRGGAAVGAGAAAAAGADLVSPTSGLMVRPEVMRPEQSPEQPTPSVTDLLRLHMQVNPGAAELVGSQQLLQQAAMVVGQAPLAAAPAAGGLAVAGLGSSHAHHRRRKQPGGQAVGGRGAGAARAASGRPPQHPGSSMGGAAAAAAAGEDEATRVWQQAARFRPPPLGTCPPVTGQVAVGDHAASAIMSFFQRHGDFWVQQDRAASFVEQPHPYLDWGHPSAATSSLDRAGSLELSEATQPQEQGQPPDP